MKPGIPVNPRIPGKCESSSELVIESAMRNNFSSLEYSRTCQAAASGMAADKETAKNGKANT
ncbi:hypothetical protein ANCDUO_09815 [Ancylostoma duodenale]|uniref:Uncharacterized protein n=1 Tax=Ancylostoma duodenale TaxID=51022 RepID=A0A0C2CSV7_9BILA|nr:hypothetical protein ANCDUO_09815 [Ancylostoma duodenale]